MPASIDMGAGGQQQPPATGNGRSGVLGARRESASSSSTSHRLFLQPQLPTPPRTALCENKVTFLVSFLRL